MDREAMALDNLRLAGYMAQRQKQRGSAYSIDELYSQALEGLWNAARTYEPGRVEFSTYACRCIENSFIREYTKDSREKFTAFDTVSLDQEFYYEDNKAMTRMDRIPSPARGPEERAMDRERAREIRKALDWLPPREAEVLRLRFGIDAKQSGGQDWQEIGDKYGITRQAAQQIGRRALLKLRGYFHSKQQAGAAI